MKKILASLLALCLSLGILAGCGSSNTPAQSGGKKTFVFGDTTPKTKSRRSIPTRPIPAGPASATASARR